MMSEKSWTRVPSILNTVTGTFSTIEKLDEVEKFREKLEGEGKIGSLASTFDSINEKILKNIKWREENEERIVNWIKSQEESDGEGGGSGATSLQIASGTVFSTSDMLRMV